MNAPDISSNLESSRLVEVVFNTPLKQPFTYRVAEGMACEVGCRVQVMLGRRKMVGFVVGMYPEPEESESPYTIKDILKVTDPEPVFGDAEMEMGSWMADFYRCSLGEALSVIIPGGKKDLSLPAFDTDDIVDAAAHDLTSAQQEAIEAICSGVHTHCYLFGVTGSGKTEVFLQAAERVIAQGKQVIYLVPEITLTHQLSRQVMKRFSGQVAILHSGLTPQQRLREWLRIRRGEVSLIIGARSAIFAPCLELGLVIIDEEHENSYKSGSSPRYHARQIAMHRVMRDGGVLVMGSATPSLEAWNLMEQGSLKRLVLPVRVSGGSMPKISIVDVRHEQSAISGLLRDRISAVLKRGKQVILFLNRRGFSYFFHCRSCGYEMHCDRCSVSLTYHRESHMMICHYCGYKRRPVEVCPDCQSLDVGYSGFGTELVEQEVRALFPSARIARLDTDSVRQKGMIKTTLDELRKGNLDILLGTQMVAKGLNLPGVELVGIVLADSGLHLPDFRAQERTFSLIVQVAGRAGRFSDHGEVLVQTYRPENRAILLAARQDLVTFYQEELEIRRLTKFPPCTRISRLVFRAKSEQKVADEAVRMAELLEQAIALEPERYAGVDLLGPVECPLAKIADNSRWHLIIRSQTLRALHAITALAELNFTPVSGLYLEIDIDPVNLL